MRILFMFFELYRNIDIIAGGQIIHLNLKNKTVFSESIPYYYDDITWCVQLAKSRETYLNILYLLDSPMWILHFFFDILMGTIFFYLLRFDNVLKCYSWNIILFMTIAMGQSVTLKPKNWIVRIFYFLMALYGLQWNAICCGVIISIIKKTRMAWQLDNIEDALYYDFNVTVPSSYYIPENLVK